MGLGLNKFWIVGGAAQAIILILFCIFTNYDTTGGFDEGQYGMMQDVNVMIFIGFGFLFCLLPKYGWSAISIALCIGAMSIEWSILCWGWINGDGTGVPVVNGEVHLHHSLVTGGIFAAAAVLIATAGVLGRASMQQLVIMMFIMVPAYSFNHWLVLGKIGTRDTGGTVYIHCFGAFFGAAVSWMLGHREHHNNKRRKVFEEEGNYMTNVLCLIGVLFLWCYYPSFNGYGASDSSTNLDAAINAWESNAKYRAIFNTYLGLIAAAITSVIFADALGNKKEKMIHIQSGVLAGGVTMGSCCDMVLEPWGALLMGTVGGLTACAGIAYVTPWLEEKLKIHDTCDCMALHGICAFMSVFCSCIAFVTTSNEPLVATLGHSAGHQAALQIAGIFTTAGVAVALGLPTGYLANMLTEEDNWYDEQAQQHFE